jgi:hypothetical protein
VCNGAPPSTATCQETIDTSQIHEGGTITFNADLTYSVSLTITGSETENIPISCLGTTCDQENMQIMQLVSMGTMYSSGSCATVGDVCSCRLVLLGQTLMETGTFTTSGSTLTIMTAGSSTAATDSYCVLGSTMTLSAMPMPGMTPTSSVVLTRR